MVYNAFYTYKNTCLNFQICLHNNYILKFSVCFFLILYFIISGFLYCRNLTRMVIFKLWFWNGVKKNKNDFARIKKIKSTGYFILWTHIPMYYLPFVKKNIRQFPWLIVAPDIYIYMDFKNSKHTLFLLSSYYSCLNANPCNFFPKRQKISMVIQYIWLLQI